MSTSGEVSVRKHSWTSLSYLIYLKTLSIERLHAFRTHSLVESSYVCGTLIRTYYNCNWLCLLRCRIPTILIDPT